MPLSASSISISVAAIVGAVSALCLDPAPASSIHFSYSPIGFRLDNGETADRHAPETMAGGLALFDFDNDGDLDLFFTNGANIRTLVKEGPAQWNRLFANDGKGRFTDVTEKAGLSGIGFDVGVAVADYDNDGFKDIFVGGVHRNTLYRNHGDGTFTDVSVRAGLNKPDAEFGPLWSVGATWADVDNDGLLDLLVVNYVAWNSNSEPVCEYQGRREYCHPKFYKKLPNQLFLNKGNGTFEDVSVSSGLRRVPGKGMAAAAADFDLDGLIDFYIPNDKLSNSLFHNKGGGKFEEEAFELGVALPENGEFISGMGTDFRDLDNDGYPDLSVVALDDETFPLFRNTGKGSFTDATASSNMARLSLPMAGYASLIYDFDNDGWKDIFVTRGHVQSLLAAPRIMVEQPNSVFRNLGKLKFAALTTEAGLQVPAKRHRGAAVGDLNGDGKLDVVVTALNASAEIWINDSPGKAEWLEISLTGQTSNRDGVGTRVKVVTTSGGQFNHSHTSPGYASSSVGPIHFGLGLANEAEEVEIRWPSGTVQVLKKVKANQVVKVTEPRVR